MALENAYQKLREIREEGAPFQSLEALTCVIQEKYANEWLLLLELYELNLLADSEKAPMILAQLETLKKHQPNVAELIDAGLELIQ